MKNLLVFMPHNLPTIPLKVFKSYIDVISADVGPDIKLIPFIHDKFNNLDYTQNDAVERGMNEFNAEWIMFMDGDMVFPKQTIPMLLETISDEFPVVSGMYFRKSWPHHGIVGRYAPNKPEYQKTAEAIGFVGSDGQQLLRYGSISHFDVNGGPFRANVLGKGCMLVKTSVFRKLQQPYFKFIDGYKIGDHTIKDLGEDMYFFASLYKVGIKGLCDPRVQCGHLKEQIVTNEDFNDVLNDLNDKKIKLNGFYDVRKEQEKRNGTRSTPKERRTPQEPTHPARKENWRGQTEKGFKFVVTDITETGAVR